MRSAREQPHSITDAWVPREFRDYGNCERASENRASTLLTHQLIPKTSQYVRRRTPIQASHTVWIMWLSVHQISCEGNKLQPFHNVSFPVTIARVKSQIKAYIMPGTPGYSLLLGRPWLREMGAVGYYGDESQWWRWVRWWKCTAVYEGETLFVQEPLIRVIMAVKHLYCYIVMVIFAFEIPVSSFTV